MSEIRLNYEEMSAVAGDVGRCAEDMRASVQRLQRAVGQLTQSWSGRARAAFDNDYAACSREMSHFPAMLDQIQIALNSTARAIRAAEQRAVAEIGQTVSNDTN